MPRRLWLVRLLYGYNRKWEGIANGTKYDADRYGKAMNDELFRGKAAMVVRRIT